MAVDEKLIEYLSKEIEAHTNGLFTFRSRMSFSVFVGPFILLGSVLIAFKGVPRVGSMDGWTAAACVGLVLSFVAMAVASAGTEIHIWRQCNAWRALIAKVANGAKVSGDDLVFRQSVWKGYTLAYIAMVVAFLCTVKIISGLAVTTPP